MLLLLQQLLKRVPSIALVARPGLGKESKDFHEEKGPYQFACYLYGLDQPPLKAESPPTSTVPFTRALQDLVALNSIIAHQLSEKSQSSSTCREAFLIVLDLLSTLVEKLDEAPGMLAPITWNPLEWLSVVLPTMEHKVFITSPSLHPSPYSDRRQHSLWSIAWFLRLCKCNKQRDWSQSLLLTAGILCPL